MKTIHHFVAYIIVLLFALTSAAMSLRRASRPLRLIVALLACTIVGEVAAFIMGRLYHNNSVVYHYFAPVYLALVALYYNQLIPFFHKYQVGWWMAAAGVVLTVILDRPSGYINAAMLMFEALAIVAMSLCALYYCLTLDRRMSLSRNVHFWLSAIFLLFWCGTFMIWVLMEATMTLGLQEELSFMGTALWLINMITYAGIGVVLLWFRQKKYHRL